MEDRHDLARSPPRPTRRHPDVVISACQPHGVLRHENVAEHLFRLFKSFGIIDLKRPDGILSGCELPHRPSTRLSVAHGYYATAILTHLSLRAEPVRSEAAVNTGVEATRGPLPIGTIRQAEDVDSRVRRQVTGISEKE